MKTKEMVGGGVIVRTGKCEVNYDYLLGWLEAVLDDMEERRDGSWHFDQTEYDQLRKLHDVIVEQDDDFEIKVTGV